LSRRSPPRRPLRRVAGERSRNGQAVARTSPRPRLPRSGSWPPRVGRAPSWPGRSPT